MMDFVSWDDFPFPTVSGKSFKIPWFQSPPSSKTWGFNLIGKTWALDALVHGDFTGSQKIQFRHSPTNMMSEDAMTKHSSMAK
jgi:hypothetical protein